MNKLLLMESVDLIRFLTRACKKKTKKNRQKWVSNKGR